MPKKVSISLRLDPDELAGVEKVRAERSVKGAPASRTDAVRILLNEALEARARREDTAPAARKSSEGGGGAGTARVARDEDNAPAAIKVGKEPNEDKARIVRDVGVVGAAIRARSEGSERRGGKSGRSRSNKCRLCGEHGHQARACPNLSVSE